MPSPSSSVSSPDLTGRSQPHSDTASLPALPPPPGPSKTFTIDIPLATEDDPSDALDALTTAHAEYIENLVLLPPSAGALPARPPEVVPTPPESTSGSRSVAELGIRPQFNLESAAQSLRGFANVCW